MKYIEQTLGVPSARAARMTADVPAELAEKYCVYEGTVDSIPVAFVYPVQDDVTAGQIDKDLKAMEANTPSLNGRKMIAVLEATDNNKKPQLIKKKVPFVVEGRQIYLPFLGTYLQERPSTNNLPTEHFLTTAQLLLLYFIYNGESEMSMSQAVRDLDMNSMTVARAADQLINLGILKSTTKGKRRTLYADLGSKELFESNLNRMISPIRRKVYLPNDELPEGAFVSGDEALAFYTTADAPDSISYAVDGYVKLPATATKKPVNGLNQTEVQVWKYEPSILVKSWKKGLESLGRKDVLDKLTENDITVDPLSLLLTLEDGSGTKSGKAYEEIIDLVFPYE